MSSGITSSERNQFRHILGALLAYSALTLVLTYPLIFHLTTRIPGSNIDEGSFLWDTWWLKYSLLDQHSNPFFANVIFYPLGMSMSLKSMTWLNLALSLPVTLTAGTILATNLPDLLAFILSGLGMYLLALERLHLRRWRGRPAVLAAFMAGLVYTFVSSRFMFTVLGQHNVVSIQWLPFTALYLFRTLERPAWRWPLLAALFALLAAWTELNFVVYLLVFAIIIFAYAVATRSVHLSRPLLYRLGLGLFAFAVGFAPLALAVVVQTRKEPLILGWGGADNYVFDLLGPFLPSTLHPIFGVWARQATSQFTDRQFAFVGYSVLILVLAGAWLGRRRSRDKQKVGSTLEGSGLWVLVTAVFFVLGLGPLLHINGQSVFNLDGLDVTVPLPYIIFHYLPILKGSRVPVRFIIMAAMSAAMLVAFGSYHILSRIHRLHIQIATSIVLSALVLFENMAIPLPLNSAVAPAPYDMIAKDPGQFAILQVPLGWRYGWGVIGIERTLVQAYQIVHEKYIFGGQTARGPGSTFDYFVRAPILTSILNLEEGRSLDPAIIESDRQLAPSALSFLDVHYVVLHGDFVGAPVDDYVQSVLPVDRIAAGTGQDISSSWHLGSDGKWIDTETINTSWVLYKVRPYPQGPPTSLDIGTNAAHLHEASGWSYDETMSDTTFAWVDGTQARALIRLDTPYASTLSLRVAPFSYQGAPEQHMQVAVNGHHVGDFQLQDSWAEYQMDVPASALRPGMNEISLSFDHLASPAKVLGSSDQRTLAAAVDWIRLDRQ